MDIRSLRVVVFASLIGRVWGPTPAALAQGPIAKYSFDEGSGNRVADSSGHNEDGVIVGTVEWVPGIKGKAAAFNGLNRIRMPSSTALNLMNGQVTVAAWVRGQGGKFRLVRPPSSYSSIRGPDFQVTGDTIHFTFNSDHPRRENPSRQNRNGWRTFPWNDWQIWTGTVDTNLSNWQDRQRTVPPFSGVEPKLQVIGDRIYYEYFGQDANGVWQIWTGQSFADGSDWRTTQRTHEPDDYRVEQEFNLQVVGNRIYYAWEQRDETDDWQTWTASSDLDGASFKSVKRTTAGGGIPQLQVVGSKIYYLYPSVKIHARSGGSRPAPSSAERPTQFKESATFAVSDIDGGAWRILRTIENTTHIGGWGAFQINDGRIYFTSNQIDEQDHVHLFTGDMDTQGNDFHWRQRTFGNENSGIPEGGRGIQVVGNKIYYIFRLDPGRQTTRQIVEKPIVEPDDEGLSVWTAESNIDGSGWNATKRTTAPPSIDLGYQGIQIVGGKAYYAGSEQPSNLEARGRGERFHAVIGTSGSNIISKGDAYGLGLTELNEARGFINGGQGYLFRAEAPEDTSGAIADSGIDDKWHHIAMTYDNSTVKLYVDGQLKASSPYHGAIGRNPFPVIIGDGFVGAIDEVSIYDRAATAQEISEWSKVPGRDQ